MNTIMTETTAYTVLRYRKGRRRGSGCHSKGNRKNSALGFAISGGSARNTAKRKVTGGTRTAEKNCEVNFTSEKLKGYFHQNKLKKNRRKEKS